MNSILTGLGRTAARIVPATALSAQVPTFGAPTPGIRLFAHQVAPGRSRAGIAAIRRLNDRASKALDITGQIVAGLDAGAVR